MQWTPLTVAMRQYLLLKGKLRKPRTVTGRRFKPRSRNRCSNLKHGQWIE